MKKNILFILIITNLHSLFAQETFTRKDSLQGGLRPEKELTLMYNIII